MNYKITNGSISYGAETILEEINFEIKEKEKIAIVGRNGCGKSTLLKAIVNNEMLEEGIGEEKFGVYKQGNPTIGFLRQVEFEDESTSLLEEILKVYKKQTDLEKRIENLEKTLKQETSDKLVKEYTNAMDMYKFYDGYTYKKEYTTALNKFGFTTQDENKKISEFSGGQRTKIAFIRLILSKPDILLLDEPTNHLDIEAIEWLENYLKTYPKAVVIVSHDRMFLNKIVTKVYEIEYASITAYKGNFTDFERQKKANYEKQLKDFEYQQKEIKRLQRIADRFRYKPTKAKMALSKLKQIERMVKVEEPNKYDLKTFNSNFKIKNESGKQVLKVRNLEIGYSEPLAKISFDLYKGQKLGIIGANGTGKSTLLKTLMGRQARLSGELEYGYHVEKAYFDQQMAFENPNLTVLEEFSKKFPDLTTTQIRNSLASFLFYGEDVEKQINVLSGGERVRLKLCEILKNGPNLLMLDEPTNHMDIVGKETLENLLKEYKGTLIFVSHDRYFVNKIADSLLVFEKNGAKYLNCSYDEYIENREEKEELFTTPKVKNKNNEYILNKERNKIKNKIKKLENEINANDLEIKRIEAEMQKEGINTDYVKLNELQEKITALNKQNEEKLIEWEELENKLS